MVEQQQWTRAHDALIAERAEWRPIDDIDASKVPASQLAAGGYAGSGIGWIVRVGISIGAAKSIGYTHAMVLPAPPEVKP